MQINFLTINILHGGIFWDNLVQFIHDANPDILSIQEVFNSNDTNLEKRFRTMVEFGKEFPWFSNQAFAPTMIDQSTKAPWGNAVLSRFPITSQKNILFGKEQFEYDFTVNDPDPSKVTEGMIETEINLAGRKIFVYSWHGVWDTHGGDTPKRDLMGDVIIKNLRGKSPIILAGDTNLYHDTKFVRRIEQELSLKSVFGGTLISTFNMKHKDRPGYATAAVDMVFVSPEFTVLEKEMPLDDVSDHRPLRVTLEF